MQPSVDLKEDIAVFQEEFRQKIGRHQNFPHPPVNFKDIQDLLMDPVFMRRTEKYLSDLLPRDKDGNLAFDKFLCFDARGFLFGSILAYVHGIPMIMARKAGKLPGKVRRKKIVKEYKDKKKDEFIEIQVGRINPGDRILVHDDALATGGTSSAAAEIIQKCGGEIAGFHFVIDLIYLAGRQRLNKYVPDEKIFALVPYEN